MLGDEEYFFLKEDAGVDFNNGVEVQGFKEGLHLFLLDDRRVLVGWPVKRGCLTLDLVLDEEVAFVGQWDLVDYIHNEPLNRN